MNWLQRSFQEADLWIPISLQTTHHKSIPIVSMGLQVLSEFVTSKTFQMRFWMMSGSDLFGDSITLPCSI